MKESMYDKLLKLPLFQGLCEKDFTFILEKIKLNFYKHNERHVIATPKSQCDKLYFIIDGKVEALYSDDEKRYTIQEYIKGPNVIEPYSLFGMFPHFSATYTTEDDTNIMTIDKSFIITRLMKFEIFNLNFLNILSNRAQTLYNKILDTKVNSTEEKIIHFINMRCNFPNGKKIISIKMEVLAEIIDDTRINVSRALNNFQKQGLVQLSRKVITIHDLKALNDFIENKQN